MWFFFRVHAPAQSFWIGWTFYGGARRGNSVGRPSRYTCIYDTIYHLLYRWKIICYRLPNHKHTASFYWSSTARPAYGHWMSTKYRWNGAFKDVRITGPLGSRPYRVRRPNNDHLRQPLRVSITGAIKMWWVGDIQAVVSVIKLWMSSYCWAGR